MDFDPTSVGVVSHSFGEVRGLFISTSERKDILFKIKQMYNNVYYVTLTKLNMTVNYKGTLLSYSIMLWKMGK